MVSEGGLPRLGQDRFPGVSGRSDLNPFRVAEAARRGHRPQWAGTVVAMDHAEHAPETDIAQPEAQTVAAITSAPASPVMPLGLTPSHPWTAPRAPSCLRPVSRAGRRPPLPHPRPPEVILRPDVSHERRHLQRPDLALETTGKPTMAGRQLPDLYWTGGSFRVALRCPANTPQHLSTKALAALEEFRSDCQEQYCAFSGPVNGRHLAYERFKPLMASRNNVFSVGTAPPPDSEQRPGRSTIAQMRQGDILDSLAGC